MWVLDAGRRERASESFLLSTPCWSAGMQQIGINTFALVRSWNLPWPSRTREFHCDTMACSFSMRACGGMTVTGE